MINKNKNGTTKNIVTIHIDSTNPFAPIFYSQDEDGKLTGYTTHLRKYLEQDPCQNITFDKNVGEKLQQKVIEKRQKDNPCIDEVVTPSIAKENSDGLIDRMIDRFFSFIYETFYKESNQQTDKERKSNTNKSDSYKRHNIPPIQHDDYSKESNKSIIKEPVSNRQIDKPMYINSVAGIQVPMLASATSPNGGGIINRISSGIATAVNYITEAHNKRPLKTNDQQGKFIERKCESNTQQKDEPLHIEQASCIHSQSHLKQIPQMEGNKSVSYISSNALLLYALAGMKWKNQSNNKIDTTQQFLKTHMGQHPSHQLDGVIAENFTRVMNGIPNDSQRFFV